MSSARKPSPAHIASQRPHVRLSVPVDSYTHAKLCAVAALRGVDRSKLASDILIAGLKDVSIGGSGDVIEAADDVNAKAP
jgi:hypothetical protein